MFRKKCFKRLLGEGWGADNEKELGNTSLGKAKCRQWGTLSWGLGQQVNDGQGVQESKLMSHALVKGVIRNGIINYEYKNQRAQRL